MRLTLPLLFIGSTLLLAPVAHAAGQATPDEAKAMAIKATEYLKEVGPEKALAAFNAVEGPWHDRDLYVIVLDGQGVAVAQGASAGLIGKNVLDLKDPDGKPFIRELRMIKDTGWVQYRWLNPLTHQVEPKGMFGDRVGDYVVGVGAYAK